MKIVVLDAATLGADLDLQPLHELGECEVFQATEPRQVGERLQGCHVAVVNKIRLNEENLCHAEDLKLICVAATGYDNIDVAYCTAHGIAVCNVVGYSSHSVAQLTVSLVLSLANHLGEYSGFVTSGEYAKSGVANRLTPVYHELYGKTWGIVGYGNIGREVAGIAGALGCGVLYCRNTPDGQAVDIDTLCREADIITLHTPLTEQTGQLIDGKRLALMKPQVILVNAARGAVTDEAAVARAIQEGRIGGFGCDVYTAEPFSENHPFYDIMHLPNVLLTPHMAWGAYEARVRCLNEIKENISSFFAGGRKGRVN